ncbi:hypothetical protein QVD17_06357 [Tagetes erecta]|uniref:F-box domain-containing protein n=1 Tax=Tagetes erecta TaxID=13708 RepID=A0AAD8LGR8_TARER|nr:hypothetical protein QVD17_06357 [Tagetes erecta]
MDRITQLPESIVHHILSYLYPKELLRMSVLSNTWFHLTASFPILDFNIDNFISQRQSFFKYVEYATSRFCCHNNVAAHRLKIIANLQKPAELDIVNTCVESLLKKGVTELEISISNFLCVQKYRLPDVLLSVSMLRYLIIYGCDLPSSFMVDPLKFKSLIELRLVNVLIDDEVITYITTSCPLLQELVIRRCDGLKTFCVIGHQNLKKVTISWNTQVERIHIEAPNLTDLWVEGTRTTPVLNLPSCKKLIMVTYFGDILPNSNSDFLSNFPSVETLVLDTKFHNLKLSSHSLSALVLLSDYSLEDIIEFRTPNLCLMHSLKYFFIMEPSSMVSDSTHLKATMKCNPGDCIDATWFQKLRQFLYKKNGLEVFNLHIRTTRSLEIRELEKLKAIELPPYELAHVQLQLDTQEESSAHRNFVDAVLWCCRPRSLILKSSSPLTDFEEQSDIVKFTYEKLLEQEDQGRTNIQSVPPSSCKVQKLFPCVIGNLIVGAQCLSLIYFTVGLLGFSNDQIVLIAIASTISNLFYDCAWTSRFCHHHNHVTASEFKFITTHLRPAELDNIVNSCRELVLNNGVRELVIDISLILMIFLNRRQSIICLTSLILLSVSVLKSLIIRGCHLPSSFMVDDLKFKSLIKLRIDDVSIDDDLIKYLTTSFPLLEVFDQYGVW